MSNYLRNLVARSINAAEVMQPRLPSLFEPLQSASGLETESSDPERVNSQPEVEWQSRRSPQSPVSQPAVTHLAIEERAPAPLPHPHPPRPVSSEAPQRSAPVPPQPLPVSPALPVPELPIPVDRREPSLQPLPAVAPAPQIQIVSLPVPDDRLPIRSAAPPKIRAPEPIVLQQQVIERLITERRVLAEQPTTVPHPEPHIIHPKPPIAPRGNSSPDVAPPIQPVFVQPVVPLDETSSLLAPPIAPLQVTPTISSIVPPPVEAAVSAPPPPTIQVTIGRIEIRATSSPATTASRSRPVSPVTSLDDYLRQQRGGQ